MGKQPNECGAVSPLELENKNKAECAAGCWLESDMKKVGKKDEEWKGEACGLGGTFRVDYGPIFNWQASAPG